MCQDIVDNILKVYLKDTEKGHLLQADGRYISRHSLLEESEEPFSSQAWLLNSHDQQIELPE